MGDLGLKIKAHFVSPWSNIMRFQKGHFWSSLLRYDKFSLPQKKALLLQRLSKMSFLKPLTFQWSEACPGLQKPLLLAPAALLLYS